MNNYSLHGCANVHLISSESVESSQRVVKIYAKCYPKLRKYQHQMFPQVNHHLCKTRSVTNTYQVIEITYNFTQDNSNKGSCLAVCQRKKISFSTQVIAPQFSVLLSTVQRILKEELLLSFSDVYEYAQIFYAEVCAS